MSETAQPSSIQSIQSVVKPKIEDPTAQLVPLVSWCTFDKLGLVKSMLNYIICPNSIRKKNNELTAVLKGLSEKAMIDVLQESSCVLYHPSHLPSSTKYWQNDTPAFTKVPVISTYHLYVFQNNTNKDRISVKFRSPSNWSFVPDASNYQVVDGISIVPIQSWTPTVEASKKTIKITLDLQFHLYSPLATTTQIFLLHFENDVNQRIVLPMLISFPAATPSALPNSIAPSSISPIFPSIDCCTLSSVHFYCSEIRSPSDVANHGHPRLAQHVGISTLNGKLYAIYETSGVNLTSWIRNPWPLGEMTLEESKFSLIVDILEALLYILSLDLSHGAICSDAFIFDSEHRLKLLWSACWGRKAPTQEEVHQNPSQYRYTAPEVFWGDMPNLTKETDAFALGVLIYEVLKGCPMVRVPDDILSGLLPSLGSLVNIEGQFIWMAGKDTRDRPSFFRGDPNIRFVMERFLSIDPSARMSIKDGGSAILSAYNHMMRGKKHLEQDENCPYSFALDSYEVDILIKRRQGALKHLEYPKVSTVSMAALPNKLESLVMNGATGVPLDTFAKLSPHFKLLSMSDLLHFPPETLSTLPPSIEQLWLGQVAQHWKLSHPHSSLKLPPALHTLVVTDLVPYHMDLSCLPSTLTVFYAGGVASSQVLDVPFEKLPTGLTALGLPCVRQLSAQQASKLPRSLSTLSLPNLYSSDRACVLALPPALSFLDFRSCTAYEPSSALESLTYMNISTIAVNENFVHYMPQGVTDLSIAHFALSKDTPESRARFPATLRTFSWHSNSVPISSEVLDALPQGLTKLSIPNADFQNTRTASSLPSQLLYLSIPRATTFDPSNLGNLPRGLTYLNARSITRIGPFGIHRLPRGLTYLDLECSCDIYESYVPWLPPHLTFLNLASVTDLTDKCLSSLPYQLRHLNLANCQGISNITNLPPNLRIFKTSNLMTRKAWNALATAKTAMSADDASPLRII